MGGFEVVMVILSAAAGACLMSAHYRYQGQAVEKERRVSEALRAEVTELRITAARRDGLSGREPDLSAGRQAGDAGEGYAPAPLLFGPRQAEELQRHGRSAVKRTRGA